MTGNRCARCGRERRHGDRLPEDPATATPHPLGGPAQAPWASFEGADVCPQCQTAEERDVASRRIVASIQREIERRRAEGVPPDPHEPALIAYAMGTRAAAEADARQGDLPAEEGTGPEAVVERPGPEAVERPGPEAAQRPDRPRLRVAITGAFLTSHPLTVRVDGYGELQHALGGRLKGPQWRTEDLRVRDGTYESGGGFTEAVPLVIARRDGVDLLPWLAAALADFRQAAASRPDAAAQGFEATPTSLAVDVYDLGVAVMTTWLDVVAAEGVGLQATARAIKQLVWLRDGDGGRAPLAPVLQRIAFDVAEQYGEAVVASSLEEVQVAWLSGEKPHTQPRSASPDERGRLLWLHPIHVLHTPERAARVAQELAPAFYEQTVLDGGVLAAGIGWSAIVATPGSRAAATPIRLTELHWAYYALYMEIDRGLLRVLNQQRWSKHAPLKQLEADADDVFADYLRVMDARARLDSHLSALGGDELAIWETVARVQRFDAVVDAVERKLDVLQKLAQRRVEQASAYRARRLGDILGALTVLTVVTVAVALIGAFLGSRTPGINSTWVRVAIVAVAIAISSLVYWAAFIRTNRARPFGARERQS
jgi:hypothetical protein